MEGGDIVRVPLANIDLQAAGLIETDKRVEMASKLVQVGYDPASVLAALDLPPMAHTGLASNQLQPEENAQI